jgi:hypothetical protein
VILLLFKKRASQSEEDARSSPPSQRDGLLGQDDPEIVIWYVVSFRQKNTDRPIILKDIASLIDPNVVRGSRCNSSLGLLMPGGIVRSSWEIYHEQRATIKQQITDSAI